MKSLFIIILASLFIFSCKTSKTAKSDWGIEVKSPFDESKYKENAQSFYCIETGQGQTNSLARKIAVLNAKTAIAKSVTTTISTVTNQYLKQTTENNLEKLHNEFKEFTNAFTETSLRNIKVVDEKSFKQEDGTYQTWVVIEIPKYRTTALTDKDQKLLSQTINLPEYIDQINKSIANQEIIH